MKPRASITVTHTLPTVKLGPGLKQASGPIQNCPDFTLKLEMNSKAGMLVPGVAMPLWQMCKNRALLEGNCCES